MGDEASPEVKTRRQAEVTCNRIGEALEDRDYASAKDATLQLAQLVGDLQEGEDA